MDAAGCWIVTRLDFHQQKAAAMAVKRRASAHGARFRPSATRLLDDLRCYWRHPRRRMPTQAARFLRQDRLPARQVADTCSLDPGDNQANPWPAPLGLNQPKRELTISTASKAGDEVSDVFGDTNAFDVAAGLNLETDVFRDILRPML
jgi:hypothetical protein